MTKTNRTFQLYTSASSMPKSTELAGKLIFALATPAGTHASGRTAVLTNLKAWPDPIDLAGPRKTPAVPRGHLTVAAVTDAAPAEPTGILLVPCKAHPGPTTASVPTTGAVLMMVYRDRSGQILASLIKKVLISGNVFPLAFDFEDRVVPGLSVALDSISWISVPAKALGLPETKIVTVKAHDIPELELCDVARLTVPSDLPRPLATDPDLLTNAFGEADGRLHSNVGPAFANIRLSALAVQRSWLAAILGSTRFTSIASDSILTKTTGILSLSSPAALQDFKDFLLKRSDVSQKAGSIKITNTETITYVEIELKTKLFHDVAAGRKYKITPSMRAHVWVERPPVRSNRNLQRNVTVQLLVSVPSRSKLTRPTDALSVPAYSFHFPGGGNALDFLTPALVRDTQTYASVGSGRIPLRPIFGPAMKTVLRTIQENDLKGLVSALLDRIRFVSDTDPLYKLLPFWKEDIKT